MERIPLDPKTESDLATTLNQIMDEAQGQPTSNFTSAPSTSGGQLKPGQWTIFSSKIYWNINGTTYYFSLTAT